MSEWVDIRKSLPKPNKYVIFALTAEGVKKWSDKTIEGFYEPWLNGMQFWRASRAPSAVQSFKDVTHWMLPEPPKS